MPTLTGLPSIPAFRTQMAARLAAPTVLHLPEPTLLSDHSTVGSVLKSAAVTTTVLGAPGLLAAGGGWLGAGAGLLAAGALVRLGVHCREDRKILMPLALIGGGISAGAGLVGGWWGAGIMTAAGVAYGVLCD